MESFVSNIIDQIQKIEQSQRMGEVAKQQFRKELEAFLIENKFLIDKYLWDNLTDVEKEGVEVDRSKRDTSYFVSAFFDPEYDEYNIVDYRFDTENSNMIKLIVEVPSRSQLLGVTGYRIPYNKETVFFDKNELKDPTDLSKSLAGIEEEFKKAFNSVRGSTNQNEY